MIFQGSKHVPTDRHFKFLESAGASEINGTTDYDRTNYFETVPGHQLELRCGSNVTTLCYACSYFAPEVLNGHGWNS